MGIRNSSVFLRADVVWATFAEEILGDSYIVDTSEDLESDYGAVPHVESGKVNKGMPS